MYIPAPPAPATPVAGLSPVAIPTDLPGLLVPRAGALATTMTVRSSTLNVLVDGSASVRGALRARPLSEGLPGRMVVLQVLEGRRWNSVARARTGPEGRFAISYVPRHTGEATVRVRFAGEPGLHASGRRLGRLSVYRPVEASWYGGAGGLACGGSLTSSTLGVASRTLPCGAIVTLRFAGRSVRVPVVDRGPYVYGRELDLTEATKRALGFGDTGQLWSTR